MRGGGFDPRGIAQGCLPMGGVADGAASRLGHGGVDRLNPALAVWGRSRIEAGGTGRPGQAGPWPVFSPLDQVGPEGVALDVTEDDAEVVIFLDGKGLEASLPDVAGGAVNGDVAADVGVHEPVHPAAQVAVVMGPYNEVEVVGHEAVGQESHGNAQAGLGEQAEERLVVRVMVEDL